MITKSTCLFIVGEGSAAVSEAGSKSADISGYTVNTKVDMENLHEIYFAGGCFWGVEEYFSRIPGVADVASGYANGPTENPSYQEVCFGSGHAETVRIAYDPSIISLQSLTEAFFRIIDPTSVNKQGNDRGVQYRTGVYFTEEADLPVLEALFDIEREKYGDALAVELEPLRNFFEAEDYHQDYLKKNPGGYCHISFDSLNQVKTEQQKAEEETTTPESTPVTSENELPKDADSK